jgi:hypothetical protein
MLISALGLILGGDSRQGNDPAVRQRTILKANAPMSGTEWAAAPID